MRYLDTFTAAIVVCGLARGFTTTNLAPPTRAMSPAAPSSPAAVSGGSDSCASATPITGSGPFLGDTVGATLDGPAFCGGIARDVWYDWTAGASGWATVSLCDPGTTFSTILAVYEGSACVGPLVDCIDSSYCSSSPVRTQLSFGVEAGDVYKIRIGGGLGASGTGSYVLTVDVLPAPGYSVCQYDDGVSEGARGLCFNASEEFIRLQRFGSSGDLTRVGSVSFTWGSPADGSTASPDGTPGTVAIWDDPNDDGNPRDAVLLQTVSFSVASSGTDTFETVAFSPAVVVSGAYFVGVGSDAVSATESNGGIDRSTPCLGRSWQVGSCFGPANYSDLGANSFRLFPMDDVDPGVWMIRVDCQDLIVPFCFPGTGSVISCPCGNPPSGADRGCDNHGAASGGAKLSGSGVPSLASDSLVLSATGENSTSLTVFWTGTGLTAPAGVVHGAGVRCVAVLKRLYTGSASAGAISRPGGSHLSVSARTSAVGSPISSGQTRRYFTVYRDPLAAGPCGNSSSTINVSNAVAVHWVP